MTDTTGTADAVSDEFAAAFAEFSTPPEQGREGEPPELATTDADHGASASDDLPAPAGQDSEAEAVTPEPAAEDIWANATPAQKAAFDAANAARERLEHAQRSDRGRIAAYQRQLSQFPAASRDSAGGDGQAAAGAKAPTAMESEQVKRFREDYPEIAEPVLAVLAAQDARLSASDALVETFTAREREDFHRSNLEAVVSEHKDYAAIAKSPAFIAFYESAPDFVRAGIERNSAEIEDAREVSAIVTLFKAEMGMTPAPASPSANAGHTQPDARRERQLRAGMNVQNRGPGLGATAPDEFEAAFNHYAAKRRASR